MVSTTKMTPQRPICTRTESRDAMPGVRERPSDDEPAADRFEKSGQENRNIDFEKIKLERQQLPGMPSMPSMPTTVDRAFSVRLDMMVAGMAEDPAKARALMADGLENLQELLATREGRAEAWQAPDAPLMRAVVEAREELAEKFPNDAGPSGATFKQEAVQARAELDAFLANPAQKCAIP